MFGNVVKEIDGFVSWITETPKSELALDFGICTAFAVICVLLLIIPKKLKVKKGFPPGFRGYMVYDGGVIMEPDKDNDGYFTSVRGSLVRFLRSMGAPTEKTDEDLTNLVIGYCKYVEKTYGNEVSDVEENIGKDYKKLLEGKIV